MAQDYRGRDRIDAPKRQPYKGDSEDLERIIRQLEKVWALEVHKYQSVINQPPTLSEILLVLLVVGLSKIL